MAQITTHVLDTGSGRPAASVRVALESQDSTSHWILLAESNTDPDGRVKQWNKPLALSPGIYRLTFRTQEYFQAGAVESFYPYVSVVFTLGASDQHLHVPLLISPFGFSTYRGS